MILKIFLLDSQVEKLPAIFHAIFSLMTIDLDKVVNIRFVALSLSFLWLQESPHSDLWSECYSQITELCLENF